MEKNAITQMPHHIQLKLCQTRPPYRQGKRLTAVKVYTINDESQHLLICGVPKIQLGDEVKKLVYPYGKVNIIELVTQYPSEEFTEAYHIHYACIQSARIAKRSIDNKNFFGGLLHVFYVPELETVLETKAKLIQRRTDVARQIKRNQQDLTNPETDKFIPKEQYHRRKKTPALPLTEERIKHCYPGETLSSICDGIPSGIDPRLVSEPSLPANWNCSSSTASESNLLPAPYQPNESIISAGNRQLNRKSRNYNKRNYKGQYINNSLKVKVVRPQLIDTRNIAKSNSTEKKNVFSHVKKVDSGIKIKLLKESNSEKKRIVIKNPSVTHLVRCREELQSSIQAAKSQIRTVMQKSDI